MDVDKEPKTISELIGIKRHHIIPFIVFFLALAIFFAVGCQSVSQPTPTPRINYVLVQVQDIYSSNELVRGTAHIRLMELLFIAPEKPFAVIGVGIKQWGTAVGSDILTFRLLENSVQIDSAQKSYDSPYGVSFTDFKRLVSPGSPRNLTIEMSVAPTATLGATVQLEDAIVLNYTNPDTVVLYPLGCTKNFTIISQSDGGQQVSLRSISQ